MNFENDFGMGNYSDPNIWNALDHAHLSATFVLVLNLTTAQPCLEFTELNMFKHLVHLSLVVLRAPDTQLKDYLVTSITQLSRDKELVTAELQRQVDSLQQQLESSL